MDEIGYFNYHRLDLPIGNGAKEQLIDKLKAGRNSCGGTRSCPAAIFRDGE